jgi:predicted phage terminase large subunit-like protein
MFEIVDILPQGRRKLRFWDMAATEDRQKKNRSGDPDYTVGLLISEYRGIFYIEDIIRVRKRPADTDIIQKATAVNDGYSVPIREEQEPGSSGISTIDQKGRNLFAGYNYVGIRSTGSKVLRAQGFSAAAGRGQIKISRNCRFREEFFNELESFPGGLHDDMVDAASGGFSELGTLPKETAPISFVNEEGSYWLDDEHQSSGYFSRA